MLATVLTTLTAACVCAQATEYGTWGDSIFSGGAIGSPISNMQYNNATNWSNLNGKVDTVQGDVVVSGAAGGNLMDITTMNNTFVNSNQFVGPQCSIGSKIDVGINNVGGSVGIQNQVVCNGLGVSTDPAWSATQSVQTCNASDPSSEIHARVSNVYGDAIFAGSAMSNSFEADSNAPNMPVFNSQINNSTVASTVNAKVFNLGGSTSLSSSAIGNTGQIIHYNMD